MMDNLQVQDLRLGNLMHAYVGFFGRDEVVSVTAIGEHIFDIRHTATSVGATSGNMGGYYPIPLTEEWLVKFGFKKITNYFFKIDTPLVDLFIDINKYDFTLKVEDDRGFIALSDFKYVHQLQNLYHALTGEELVLNAQD